MDANKGVKGALRGPSMFLFSFFLHKVENTNRVLLNEHSFIIIISSDAAAAVSKHSQAIWGGE